MVGNRPTLAVLARELGISATTVSNAFNRPDQLSPELRDRVLAAFRSAPAPAPRTGRKRPGIDPW